MKNFSSDSTPISATWVDAHTRDEHDAPGNAVPDCPICAIESDPATEIDPPPSA